jgi:anti-sigma factor RsiW
MSCAWSAKIDQYLDSELADAEWTEVHAHLHACESCIAQMLERLQLKQAVKDAGPRYLANPEFRLKVERSVETGVKGRIFRAPLVAGIAAAAALLVFIGFSLHSAKTKAGDFAELADLHASALASANPVDVVSDDRHTVKPWFESKVPFAFNLPELRDSAFVLIGGRSVYFGQSPCAQLLFGSSKHRVSVFIFQNRGTQDTRSVPGNSIATFGSETWDHGGLRYVVVGDMGLPDLHRLMELFRAAANS